MVVRRGWLCLAAALVCAAFVTAPVAAQEKDVLWAVSQAPADACVVAVIRNVQELETALKAYVGPEGESIELVKPLEAKWPAGAMDAAGPLVAILVPSGESVDLVVLARIKDEAKLTGEAAEGNLIKVGDTFILKMAPWAAMAESAETLKAFASATTRMTGLEAQREAISAHLAWATVNPTKTAIAAQEKAPEGQAAPAMAKDILTWLVSLLGDVQSLTAVADVKAESASVVADIQLVENTPLAAVVAATLPIEGYKSGLPLSDRIVAAGWMRMDWGKAIAPVKTIIKPLVDIMTAKADEAAKKSIADMWAMYDQWAAVMGSDVALVMEPAPPGQGMYRLAETFTVKDPAEFAKLKAKMMASSKDLMKAMMGQMSVMPGAPFMKMDMDYKEAAETIEGAPVDVMKMKVDIQLPPDAPPEAKEQMKAMMDATYGPEGMMMRMALIEKTAVFTIGGPDVMAKAIKTVRGQAPDLTTDPKVAAAVGRLPKGICAGGVISFANLAYMAMSMADQMLSQTMPPEIKEAAKAANLPPLEAPPAADLSTTAVTVKGRSLHVELAMPQADVQNAVQVAKRASERMMWVMQQQMKMMQERMEKEGAAGATLPAALAPGAAEQPPAAAPGAATAPESSAPAKPQGKK